MIAAIDNSGTQRSSRTRLSNLPSDIRRRVLVCPALLFAMCSPEFCAGGVGTAKPNALGESRLSRDTNFCGVVADEARVTTAYPSRIMS